MKKSALFLIGLIGFSVTGCVDIVHHITYKSDGSIQNTIRITVSKAVMSIAAGMEGVEFNEKDLFDELKENQNDMKEYEIFSPRVETINDTSHLGYLLDMNIDTKNKNVQKAIANENIDFIPKFNNKNISISISSFKNADSGVNNEMGQLFLSSGKYRLLINKSAIPSISKVLVTSSDKTSQMEISFTDLHDEYLIEIPIIVFFENAAVIEIYK